MGQADPGTTQTEPTTPDAVRESLRGVADPCCRERGISVVDMGLLEHISVDGDGTARVDVVLTSGWCPFQGDLLGEIATAAEAVPGVRAADVRVVLAPAWSRERMSAHARARLQMLPEPREVADRTRWLAARPDASPAATVDPTGNDAPATRYRRPTDSKERP